MVLVEEPGEWRGRYILEVGGFRWAGFRCVPGLFHDASAGLLPAARARHAAGVAGSQRVHATGAIVMCERRVAELAGLAGLPGLQEYWGTGVLEQWSTGALGRSNGTVHGHNVR